jgi:hypothetical protein
VPERFSRAGKNWSAHYPDRFDELLDDIQIRFPGQVFMVGAGICGKVYCHEIAQRGGIGIDIGAACDAWLGIASRPLVLQSRYGTERVPLSLTLPHQLSAVSSAPQNHDFP